MHYLHSSLDVRMNPSGERSVVAVQPIRAMTLMAAWGGVVMTTSELEALPDIDKTYSLQFEDHLYLVTPIDQVTTADFINHSCDPNCGLDGQIALRSIRDITAGEEVTLDYAMFNAAHAHTFECGCRSAHCRGLISGDDWRLPELQQRYAGWFAPFIQRMIDQSAATS